MWLLGNFTDLQQQLGVKEMTSCIFIFVKDIAQSHQNNENC